MLQDSSRNLTPIGQRLHRTERGKRAWHHRNPGYSGGVFVALGAAPLILNASAAYQMLGVTYLIVGATRAVSMFIDKSAVQSNAISLVVEIAFGIILVL